MCFPKHLIRTTQRHSEDLQREHKKCCTSSNKNDYKLDVRPVGDSTSFGGSGGVTGGVTGGSCIRGLTGE